MNHLSLVASLALAAMIALPAAAEPFREAFPALYQQIDAKYQARIGALELLHGTVPLSGGVAEIVLPEGYYALGAVDAQYMIQTVWNNPPDTSILGLILRAGTTPLDDDAWAVVLQYDPLGYVADSDAASIDYDDLLADMKAGTNAENAERTKAGFPTIALLGWAAPPRYDAVERKLHWAKRLRFQGDTTDTLNYNIRVLGRKGVMVANFVAGIALLPDVQAAVPQVLTMIRFTDGNRYADFDPGLDTVAAVGIGGLIAGKVAAKAGLLIVLLAFLKKGAFLVVLPLIWIGSRLRRRGKSDGTNV